MEDSERESTYIFGSGRISIEFRDHKGVRQELKCVNR